MMSLILNLIRRTWKSTPCSYCLLHDDGTCRKTHSPSPAHQLWGVPVLQVFIIVSLYVCLSLLTRIFCLFIWSAEKLRDTAMCQVMECDCLWQCDVYLTHSLGDGCTSKSLTIWNSIKVLYGLVLLVSLCTCDVASAFVVKNCYSWPWGTKEIFLM